MTLAATIACATCRAEVQRLWPDREPVSRAAVNELHWDHRPMHPNEVGANHRRRAKAEYDAWEAAGPYRDVA